MLSGQFLELTAALEAAVLLGRRLVLPDNWDCSALEAVGICGTLVETKGFLRWKWSMLGISCCRRPKVVCLNGLAYWNEKRFPFVDRLRYC